jgi:hypothetical protein
LLFAALDGNYSAKKFSRRNRRIVVAEAVAARNQERFTLSCEELLDSARAAHHAVSEHSPFARVEHDIPSGYFGNRGPLDGDQITGNDGWHHAGAEDTKTNFSECADYFSGQTARQRHRHIFPSVHMRLTAGYEAFLLLMQLLWLENTLPHCSADTSKTGSNRNEGALYGFFPVEAAASRALSLVDLLMFKCCAPLLLLI